MSNIGLELASLGFARGISYAANVNDFFNYCAGSLNLGSPLSINSASSLCFYSPRCCCASGCSGPSGWEACLSSEALSLWHGSHVSPDSFRHGIILIFCPYTVPSTVKTTSRVNPGADARDFLQHYPCDFELRFYMNPESHSTRP